MLYKQIAKKIGSNDGSSFKCDDVINGKMAFNILILYYECDFKSKCGIFELNACFNNIMLNLKSAKK